MFRLHGVRVEWDEKLQRQREPVFYLFNHHSNLDIFIIAALGLSKLRTFFSTERKAHWPLMLSARSMGTFLLPPQHEHAARVACFKQVEVELRKNRESMIASPEGERFVQGGMGPFNKGVFHLALNLGYSIVPLYFDIPDEDNPKLSFEVRPTTIKIVELETVSTKGLTENSIEALRDNVRAIYVSHIEKRSQLQCKNNRNPKQEF